MDIKLKQEVINVNKGVLVYNIVVIAVLLLTSMLKTEMLLGLVLGTLVALMNFVLLAKAIEKSIDMSPNEAKLYASSRYSVRMMIIAVVLFVAAKSPKLNLIGVFLGLISPKIVILVRNKISDKLKRKES
ncbi:MAG: ATP synthase subunit I [Peptostreptococcaceae bacterium]